MGDFVDVILRLIWGEFNVFCKCGAVWWKVYIIKTFFVAVVGRANERFMTGASGKNLNTPEEFLNYFSCIYNLLIVIKFVDTN